MAEKIESMDLEQLEKHMAVVAKRAAALGQHKNEKEILDITKSVFRMKPKKLNSMSRITEASEKLDDIGLRYISVHATDISLGKSVRVPRIEFPWSKNGLIRFSNACRDAETYMHNFSRLKPNEQAKIGGITKLFTDVDEISKKISQLSGTKSSKRGTRKTKTLRAEKNATKDEPTEVVEAEKKAAKKKTTTAQKATSTKEKKKTEATVEPKTTKVDVAEKPVVVPTSEPEVAKKEAVAK